MVKSPLRRITLPLTPSQYGRKDGPVILNLIQNLSVTAHVRSDPSTAVGMTNDRGLVIPDLIRNLSVSVEVRSDPSAAVGMTKWTEMLNQAQHDELTHPLTPSL